MNTAWEAKTDKKIPEIQTQVLIKSFTIRPITRIIFDSQQNINQKRNKKKKFILRNIVILV